MKKKKWKTVQAALLLVVLASSVMAIMSTFLWAQPCDGVLELANGNAVPMRCFYTAKIAVLLHAMLAVMALVTLFFKVDLRIALILAALAAIAVTFESFIGIGVCKSEMACWVTAFWIRVSACISLICTLVSYVFGQKQVQN